METADSHRLETTWRWARAEHAALVLVLGALVIRHADDVAWGRFLSAFILIDLVGYLPGAIAFRRASDGVVAPVYYHLYNVTHSYLTASAGFGIWLLAHGGFEWAMLALPIHLSGDRGLLGNGYKPVSLPFESSSRRPKPTPVVDRATGKRG